MPFARGTGDATISIPNIGKTGIQVVGGLWLLVLSAQAGAAALVWNNGNWGDTWQSQPTSASDSDGDGVSETLDAFPSDNAEWADTDSDGIGNNSDLDDDNDGILDYVDTDADNDGLSDEAEDELGTNPLDPDTDGDGQTDYAEVNGGRNPLVNEGAIILLINSE